MLEPAGGYNFSLSLVGPTEEEPSASERVRLSLHNVAPYANDTIPRDLYGVPVSCYDKSMQQQQHQSVMH